MAAPSGPRPAPARGTLREVPVAHALVYVRNKRLGGVFEVVAPDGRKASVRVWRGRLAHATTTPAIARFGSVAYELGIVDAATLDDVTTEATKRKVPQVDILAERGAITSQDRERVVAEQLRRRVHHLFTFPETSTFTFREDDVELPEPELLVDPLAPVWRGICDFPEATRIRDAVARVGTSSLVMVSEAVLERAELDAPERAFCEALAARPSTLAELLAKTHVPRASAERVLYLLLLAQCVEPVAHASRPSGMQAAAPEATAPPSFRMRHVGPSAASLPRSPEEIGIEGIRIRAARIGHETAYEALGLDGDASPEAVRAAYFRLARAWNPAKLPVELRVVEREVARVHAWLGTAMRAILDADAAEG